MHFGPNRVSFRPFLFIEAGGLAVDIFLHGNNYLDVQFGGTHISVSSQGRCACNAKEPEDVKVSHFCLILFCMFFFSVVTCQQNCFLFFLKKIKTKISRDRTDHKREMDLCLSQGYYCKVNTSSIS